MKLENNISLLSYFIGSDETVVLSTCFDSFIFTAKLVFILLVNALICEFRCEEKTVNYKSIFFVRKKSQKI